MRQRLELVALAASSLAVVAFVLSFALGLRGGIARPVELPRRNDEPEIVAPLRHGNERRVEVLNASQRSGLAREATIRLREAGYDVVYYGNASDSDEGESLVIDRVGNSDVARGAARVLGVSNIVTRIDSTRMVEASVIIAKDWQTAPEANATRQSWWNRLLAWLRPGS